MSKCTACGFENDSTRVFCQNCGERLVQTEGGPAPVAPHRYTDPSARPAAPQGGLLLLISGLFKELIRVALPAAIAAGLVQMLRVPNDIPAVVAVRAPSASMLAADIQTAVESPYPRSLDISQEAANNFLSARIEGAAPGRESWRATFSRSYVVIHAGNLTFGIEQKIKNYPVYLQLKLEPRSSAEGATLEPVGGSIGRLPVPQFLLPFFKRPFEPVLTSIAGQLRWFEKADKFTFVKEMATVSWPANSSPETP
ncbi:MAG: zinc ribbon domain-containing protein [Terrimicrobiaceae bacterium]